MQQEALETGLQARHVDGSGIVREELDHLLLDHRQLPLNTNRYRQSNALELFGQFSYFWKVALLQQSLQMTINSLEALLRTVPGVSYSATRTMNERKC